ncbi:MAG: endonuclease/exonuclease/phosphatase family protein [Terriglobia bacterium]
MVTFLYWNTNRKALHSEIRALTEVHDVDVVILSEFVESPATLIEHLNSGGARDFQFAPGECDRIWIFTRFSSSFLKSKYEDDWVSIRQLKLPARLEILLVAAHLPSKRFQNEHDQEHLSITVARTIMEQEKNVGHQRTVLVGDLNMNPFEKGVVNADGMNAVMSRQVASRKSRTVMRQAYPFFFNPMWAHFGDRQEDPPGTHYYNRSGQVNYFWNIFDQVMVRPELMDRFDSGTVRIPTKIGETSLLFEDGRPNKRDFSDHLPLLFEVEL